MKINGEVYRKAVLNNLSEHWIAHRIKEIDKAYRRLMKAKQPKIKKVR